MIPAMKRAIEKAQAQHKRDLDARVSRSIPFITTDDYLFLRKKYYNLQNDKRYKLSSIAHGPYRVISTDDSGFTVVYDIKGSMNASRGTALYSR